MSSRQGQRAITDGSVARVAVVTRQDEFSSAGFRQGETCRALSDRGLDIQSGTGFNSQCAAISQLKD